MNHQVYCAYCKQPLQGTEGELGYEVLSCHICMAKIETDVYRQFIQSLPASLLAAARTLEQKEVIQEQKDEPPGPNLLAWRCPSCYFWAVSALCPDKCPHCSSPFSKESPGASSAE